MALIDIDTLAALSGPIMGLDPGTKTIGIAISDRTRLISTPLETIKRKKFTPDATRLFEVYAERECCALVIGLPLNMDGSSGPRVQSTRDFATNLMGVRDVPYMFWDERLSTAAVTRTMIESDISRAKRAQAVDKLAASYILQGVLDRLRR
ncbi:Holliday junction resolvase RuvX [Robiginitomaculum antarcticum]|uniref:Holliday junction resolvase RuvX n=1 Tax=Robiginitomaculum antarcticum TaxID=437507 RepID=UPI000382103B|nr:Holliday junction resolvase RuvX [Robiginitomaculum antarcticum]